MALCYGSYKVERADGDRLWLIAAALRGGADQRGRTLQRGH